MEGLPTEALCLCEGGSRIAARKLLQDPMERFFDELEIVSLLERARPIHPGDSRFAGKPLSILGQKYFDHGIDIERRQAATEKTSGTCVFGCGHQIEFFFRRINPFQR